MTDQAREDREHIKRRYQTLAGQFQKFLLSIMIRRRSEMNWFGQTIVELFPHKLIDVPVDLPEEHREAIKEQDKIIKRDMQDKYKEALRRWYNTGKAAGQGTSLPVTSGAPIPLKSIFKKTQYKAATAPNNEPNMWQNAFLFFRASKLEEGVLCQTSLFV